MWNKPEPEKWVFYFKRNPTASERLFCLPFAGTGATIFRGWENYLPAKIEICPVQLPGRETRLKESAFTRLYPLVEALAEGLEPLLDKPFSIFGHSMGALLAFELTRLLQEKKLPLPRQLFLSARPAPQFPGLKDETYRLPHNDFVAKLRQMNGTPEQVLNSPPLLEMLLPILRADFELCSTYNYLPAPPLSIPMRVYGGIADRTLPPESLAAWEALTTGKFSLQVFEGDHFFFLADKERFLSQLSRDLTESPN